VDLDDLRDLPLTRTVLTEATERIMRAITKDVAILRGAKAPEVLWDPSDHGQAAQGRDFENGSSSKQSKENES
jgi:1-acyl-sn-glycerol-3-phosphate acyltransferase